MIKLIASDMDGTLLDEQRKLSPITIEAVKIAQQKGIQFVVATGRAYSQAKYVLDQAGISCPLITLNGAQLFNEEGELQFSHPIDKQLTHDLLTNFQSNQLSSELMTSKGIFIENKERWITKRTQSIYENDPSIHSFEEATTVVEKMAIDMELTFVSNFRSILSDVSIDILKVYGESEEGPQILNPIKDKLFLWDKPLHITSSELNNIEINHSSAQKGIALKRFAHSLNIDASQTMSIGDNLNDLSMLKWAQYSFALENGMPETKEIARFLTTTNHDHGVAKAIHKILNNELQELPVKIVVQ
ncbi:Cof-type HAD-IIB family hydrolase [Lacticigenium naphthae]|uniref:Cof-type HAD-IIB family hydrolase n=1 Tax=Lacticigenium naphthae TaxID=515351 RepID=UPI000405315F|nr:Cof-type HAD-IIB family hydrolase [Lacticigenium naphthae]